MDTPEGDVGISLGANEKRTITFLLRDSVSGSDVTKKITFDADRYSTDLEVMIKRGNQILPQARLKIGPSIGDQGVKHYTFYSVAPEAIAGVGEEVQRHAAAAINVNKNSPDRLSLAGPVDWAGVGDTYFAMVAIPSKRFEGLEYRTTQYNHQINGSAESRYLLSAFVRFPATGRNHALCWAQDHYILRRRWRSSRSPLAERSTRRTID